MQLTAFQDGFSAALRGQAMHAPWLSALESQPGFAVYRNTVLKGCIDALQASYPTVCQLVGTDWFRAAAAVYARAQPPRDGLVVGRHIGDVFFGQRFGNAAHRGVLALALLVGHQGGGDELGALARDHGHLVDLGKAGLVANDAMAANAHGNLLLAGFHVALGFLGMGESGHGSDSQGK